MPKFWCKGGDSSDRNCVIRSLVDHSFTDTVDVKVPVVLDNIKIYDKVLAIDVKVPFTDAVVTSVRVSMIKVPIMSSSIVELSVDVFPSLLTPRASPYCSSMFTCARTKSSPSHCCVV